MADQAKDTKHTRASDEEIRREHESELNSPEFQKSSAGLARQGAVEAQSAGTGGTIGGEAGGSEYGPQGAGSAQGATRAPGETATQDRAGSKSPLGAGHEQSADGGSVTAAGSGSTGPGAGQAGTDRSPGFVGSQGEESGEHLQDRDPQQAGFAEQGRGAPEEGRDVERGGERTANLDSDVEGSSDR